MRVIVYPADRFGCGYHRLIWPAQELARQGHDVKIVWPGDKRIEMHIDTYTGEVVKIVPPRCDVIVLQRVAHRYIASAIHKLREQGVAVVVDIDDNLNEIHPLNPAFNMLHPANEGRLLENGTIHRQSWEHLNRACRDATLVTVSTQALVQVYGTRAPARVLHNTLDDRYFETTREDNDVIGWPASLHSHPTDPSVTRGAVGRLVEEGATFRVLGNPEGVARAFRLAENPLGQAFVDVLEWHTEVARLGIGIVPAVDTIFNAAKSWLKPLELSATGVPWVASPVAEYERIHRLGAGLLARSGDEWYDLLRRLVREPSLRADLSAAGREVAATLRLRDHAWRWWEAWSEARAVQDGAVARRSIFV